MAVVAILRGSQGYREDSQVYVGHILIWHTKNLSGWIILIPDIKYGGAATILLIAPPLNQQLMELEWSQTLHNTDLHYHQDPERV
jgi:hypothetical protein